MFREVVKEKEVIVKVRCGHCDTLFDSTFDRCPYCGEELAMSGKSIKVHGRSCAEISLPPYNPALQKSADRSISLFLRYA